MKSSSVLQDVVFFSNGRLLAQWYLNMGKAYIVTPKVMCCTHCSDSKWNNLWISSDNAYRMVLQQQCTVQLRQKKVNCKTFYHDISKSWLHMSNSLYQSCHQTLCVHPVVEAFGWAVVLTSNSSPTCLENKTISSSKHQPVLLYITKCPLFHNNKQCHFWLKNILYIVYVCITPVI